MVGTSSGRKPTCTREKFYLRFLVSYGMLFVYAEGRDVQIVAIPVYL